MTSVLVLVAFRTSTTLMNEKRVTNVVRPIDMPLWGSAKMGFHQWMTFIGKIVTSPALYGNVAETSNWLDVAGAIIEPDGHL